MKKLDKIRVLVPLNVVLYLVALWVAGPLPAWGNLALAVVCILTILVVYLVVKRYIEVHKLSSWEQAGPKVAWVFIVLVVMAIFHVIGSGLHNDIVQHIFAYAPITLLIGIGAPYLLMKGKPPYYGI